MGNIEYGDEIRRVKNRNLNTTEKIPPKTFNSPKKLPESTEIFAPKENFVDQPQT